MYSVAHPLLLKKIRVSLLLWVTLSIFSYAFTNPLSVQFSDDTVFVCAGKALTLEPTVQGGNGPLSYVWNTGAHTPLVVVSFGVGQYILWVEVTDGIQTLRDSVSVMVMAECVWPGDANGDGAANNFDLLAVGRAYSASGMSRPKAHLNWLAQPAPSWAHSFANGVNYVHSDVNGDGLVDGSDAFGILHNYQTPQASGGSGGSLGAPLFIQQPTGQLTPGDSIILQVMLGTPSHPAQDVYGIAFSLDYSGISLPIKSIRLETTGSWLGHSATDLLAISKNFGAHHQLDVALSRNDQTERAGYGMIASIIITVEDVAGKVFGIEEVEAALSRIQVISKLGTEIPVRAEVVSFFVVLNNESLWNSGYQIGQDWPHRISVRGLKGINQTHIQVFDFQGRQLGDFYTSREPHYEIAAGDWASGGILVVIQEPNKPPSVYKLLKP